MKKQAVTFTKWVAIRVLFLLATTLGFGAFAQNAVGTNVTRGDALKRREYQTYGTLNLFVDTAGNDANACTSAGANACLTIQGATNKVPKGVRNPALITVGAGSFTAGAYVDGFWMSSELNDPTSGSYLQYDGTLANATVATGTATGTATGGTAGTPPTANGTLVDGAQTWTVNDLRGKIIEILTGTGAGQRQQIRSNTATSIEIVGDWTAPVAGSTYRVADSVTLITGSLALPAQNSFTASAASSGAFIIGSTPRADTGVTIRWMKFTTTGVAVSNRGGGVVRLNENFFTAGTTSNYLTMAGGSAVIARNFWGVSATTNIFAIGFLSTAFTVITSTEDYFRGGGTGRAIGIATQQRFVATNSEFENLEHGIRTQFGDLVLSGVRFDTITGECLGSNASGFTTAQMGQTSILLTTANFANCGTAIRVDGSNVVTAQVITGATNTTIYSIQQGGIVQEGATSSVTGTTEINLDGTTYTIAALRALTPKSITNIGTLSRIWEP